MLPGENRGGFKKQNKGKKNASLEPGNVSSDIDVIFHMGK